ncbi:MAG: TraB/GumN family protein [Chitinophagales bacterium]|nr:TraB/GumN family protein [Chitinophagales bacterium]MCZ2394703.1 TraB/GumN family protein [Chitinophagales bacterium]
MFCKPAIRSSKLFVAFIIVLVSSCKTAQKTNESVSIELDKAIDTDKTLLWQVSGHHLNSPSYLFGSIHVISGEDFSIGNNVLKKLNQSQRLVIEMDLDNVNSIAVAKASILPDNKTVKDYLNDEDYLTLETFFAESLGTPLSLFKTAYARLKPFFLQQMIYVRYLGNNTSSYEVELMDLMKDHNGEIVGLETLEEQLSFIDKMSSLEDQYQSLIKAIHEDDEQKKFLDTLIQTYQAKDIQKLYEMTVSQEDFKDITNTLLDQRNINWIPKIDSLMQKGTSFIAVGAGHLGGPTGLISLLRKEGYNVEPISMD